MVGRGSAQGLRIGPADVLGSSTRLIKQSQKPVQLKDTITWTFAKKHQTSSLRLIHGDEKTISKNFRADLDDFNFLHSRISNNARAIYSQQFLRTLTKSELKFLRNEIFARYGYIFKSKDLMEYFAKLSWYEPKYEMSMRFSPRSTGRTLSSFHSSRRENNYSKVILEYFLLYYDFLKFCNVSFPVV